ncbi:MAG TPA: IPT/TIG domain-containing protein, partial [Longimicrobiales bacterium]|nr:IPT/TIG domain-containing protein [Longimicrobiales bacterium]
MRLPVPDLGTQVRPFRATAIRALALGAAGLALAQACTTLEVVGVRVTSVEVTPASATITEGTLRQFTATVRDEAGTPIPLVQVAWSVDGPSVAQIDQSGLATALKAGTTTVRAEFQGISGQATLTVEPGALSNVPPTATITAPANNSSSIQGSNVTFTGTGTDPEDGTLTGASLVWTSNLAGQIGTGASVSTTVLVVGIHIITLTVTDSYGATDTDQITVSVTSANRAPTAAITAPANGSTFTQGDNITFTGTGTDPEDGALSGARLVWTSQLDGPIGTGTSFSTGLLSLGTHIITLRATDSGGAIAAAQIVLTVLPVPAPTVTSISPSAGPTAGGTSVTIGGTGFRSGATVTIGGTAAINVVFGSATSITATTPAHSAGLVNVVVTNPDAQTGTLTNGFTYQAPAPPPPAPAIGLSATTATFNATVGGADPGAQQINVTNAGTGTLNGLSTVISYQAGQPTGWLTAALNQTTAPATITLSAAT